MKTTRLVRHSPLRRRTPLRSRGFCKLPKRSQREFDDSYLKAVRKLPCIVRSLPPDPNRITPCSGEVQADHLGDRPLGRKAHDNTACGMCRKHHAERTDHHGAFFNLTRDEARVWREKAIASTREQVFELMGVRRVA